MSAPPTPHKHIIKNKSKSYQESNNNTSNNLYDHQQARRFVTWYKHMIDDDRYNLGLYISDDAILEWFGRTIKTRKKVTAFMKHHIQCSRHDFITIEGIENLQSRNNTPQRKDESTLASPIHSPELISSNTRYCKRLLRSNCNSPEWAEGCQPLEDSIDKKCKTDNIKLSNKNKSDIANNVLKRPFSDDENRGDGILHKIKRKCVPVTPPNCEVGQGDCLPSTSGTDSDRSHDTLNAHLPKLAVECNGYIEFTRTKNRRNVDTMTWERKCKIQISYSEDPLNTGEYIIWVLRYTDENKCRRNLLAAFEEISNEDDPKKM